MKTIILTIATILMSMTTFSQSTTPGESHRYSAQNIYLTAYMTNSNDTIYELKYQNIAVKNRVDYNYMVFNSKSELYELIDLINTTYTDDFAVTPFYLVAAHPNGDLNNSLVFLANRDYFYADKNFMLALKEDVKKFK